MMQKLFYTKPDNFKSSLRVVVCIIEYGNEVLFVKRSQNVSLPGTWSIPGGKVDPGETLEQAAIREIREECGVVVSDLIYLATVYICNDEFDYEFTMFRYTALERPEVILDTYENDNYAWLDRQEVAKLDQQNLLIPKEMECLNLVYGTAEFGSTVTESL